MSNQPDKFERRDKFEHRLSASASRRGFTLVEMITVLTIIILVLAIAIPVWNALMGGTNLAAAQNQVAAFIGNARSDAVYNRQTIGVLFFIDPKTQQTAMAEVQVQPIWNPTTLSFSPLFMPNVPNAGNNGLANVLEFVNTVDPTSTPISPNPPNRIFYRDIALLPPGVGVALNNNTYTYNQASTGSSYYFSFGANPNNVPPLDRYLRLGAIMFSPDGTLATIPIGIPFYELLSSGASAPKTDNLVCQRLGMFYSSGTAYDVASNVNSTGTPASIPLLSSVGLVIFDHDAYLSQHATQLQQGNTSFPGSGAQFNDLDMNYTLYTAAWPGGISQPNTTTGPVDKAIEENWIDQNGTAYLVTPFNGSLIKAK